MGARVADDRIAAAAFVYQGAAAGTASVTACEWGFRGWYDFGDAEVLVQFFDDRVEEGGGALRLNESGDLHGSFEAGGGRGLLVGEDLSKSVDCEVGGGRVRRGGGRPAVGGG